ncbi:glycosyltransferase family 2 protein [Peribacillus frigoritolerans]|uniref:glycosyltransferase family 2 protein n=1 Tax=Peribacillus frigoritolerans TaxID=450367 RepID=UPI0020798FEF|nr:glycosyltransferase family A protein [Peribacillus frigoritolerans]USK78798.1 glycosyltransferase family 2 protein [Peribacillus frigoritolerans]
MIQTNDIIISIVVICKNEEGKILKCLNSIFHCLEISDFKFEVILVDSNSTDRTIEKAINQYSHNPFLHIYQITEADLFSASLGRYVGLHKSKGKYILFLDGDMELEDQFLPQAILKLENSPESCVGIIGIRNDILTKENNQMKISNVYNTTIEKRAAHFGGALLIERKILDEVGGHNPNLISNEEPELYLRLIERNYYIKEIPIEMINHYDKKIDINDKIKALFSKRSLGIGQCIKASLLRKSFSPLFQHNQIKQFIIPILFDIVSVFTFILYLVNGQVLFLFLTVLLQILNAVICTTLYKSSKFILSKVFLIPTIIALINFKNTTQHFIVKKIQ